MSLVTSCPACGTMFRVVPDQLKISEGWVRCGHCAEVFDAAAYLTREDPVTLPAEPEPEFEEAVTDPVPVAADEPATEPADLPGPEQGGWQHGERPPSWRRRFPPNAERDAPVPPWPDLDEGAAASRPPGPPARLSTGDSEIPQESALDMPFVFRRSDLTDSEPLPSQPMLSQPAPLPSRPAELASRPAELRPATRVPDEDAAIESVSFVRQARRRAFWRRPMVRLGLTFVSLLLGAALVLQVAYHDRDRLAAAQPQLQPALLQMCEVLACKLAPPRQIDAIAIESSTFNRLRGDTYRLSFTLRNASPMAVAAPSIELTLTDTQDQPVLRRVLSPAEIGAPAAVLPAATDWTTTLGLAVAPGNPRVAGYRLLAFYP